MGCVVSGSLRRDSGSQAAVQVPVTGSSQPVWWSKVCGCFCWACLCSRKTKLSTKVSFDEHWAQEQIIQNPKATHNLSLPASACWLPIKFSHWKSLWLYSSTGCKLHRVGQDVFQSVELLLSPRLKLHGGEYSTQKICLQYGGMTQHRDPGNWPFSFPPKATKHKFFSLDSSPFFASLPKRRMSGCKWNLCVGPLRGFLCL